jgi:hypothetical protein
MNEAMEGLAELSQKSTALNTSVSNMSNYILAAILCVALMPVVWALATNQNHAKTYLITWFVALVFSIIFVIGN